MISMPSFCAVGLKSRMTKAPNEKQNPPYSHYNGLKQFPGLFESVGFPAGSE